jgi:hypothetical protein
MALNKVELVKFFLVDHGDLAENVRFQARSEMCLLKNKSRVKHRRLAASAAYDVQYL